MTSIYRNTETGQLVDRLHTVTCGVTGNQIVVYRPVGSEDVECVPREFFVEHHAAVGEFASQKSQVNMRVHTGISGPPGVHVYIHEDGGRIITLDEAREARDFLNRVLGE